MSLYYIYGWGDTLKNDIIHMNIGKGDKLIVTPLPDVRLKITGKTTKTIEGVEFKMKKIWTEDQLVEINEIKNGISNNAQAIKKLDGRMDNMEKRMDNIEKRMGNVEVNLDKLVKHFNIV